MSIASRPHMASIEPEPIRTGNHEHRQLLILSISDLSYVHAPNTVNRYSELGKTIPMSHRAPSHILSFACRSGVFCGQFALSFRVLGEGVMLHHVAMLFLIFKIQYFCRHGRTIFLANTIHILVLSSACGHEAAQKLGCLKQYLRIVKHLNARSIWFYLVCLDHWIIFIWFHFMFVSQLFQCFSDCYELFIAFCQTWSTFAAGFEEGFVYVPLANWCI